MRSAEIKTSSARALLEEMIDSMREGVIALDSDFEVFTSNRAARMLLGEGRSRAANILENEAVRNAFRSALDRFERTETKVEVPIGNDNRVYDLRVAPLSFADSPGERRALGIFYDITRIERLEKVRQEFLSNVSHELRTPLTSILASVETLEEGALEDPESNRRFLEMIRRNAVRMHHLIDDILELSAIEAGKVSVQQRRVKLAPLVEEICAGMSQKADLREVTLINEVARGFTVYADKRRLEQVLSNLISNAIKFNRRGGTVTVSSRKQNGHDLITVADTGGGIEPEHLPRIFERFYRTDTARSRELGGTGLGLAIVKHLTRLHGGEVRVESGSEGSIFTVELPRE